MACSTVWFRFRARVAISSSWPGVKSIRISPILIVASRSTAATRRSGEWVAPIPRVFSRMTQVAIGIETAPASMI